VFNAGTGACLNEEGNIELDATLMDGSGRRAGAVGALPPFDHPIAIARAVLEEGRHVLLVGDGARRFAEANGFAPSQTAAMTSPGAQERWEAWKRGGKVWPGGTVGAVARDASGRVAAATSTGGMVGKAPGRVGDSAVVGAGTYAEDLAGSASCTGHGEAMIRLVAASRAVEFLRDGVAPEDAARAVIGMLGDSLGAKGGIILADRWGRLGFARNTETMAWAALGEAFPQGAAGMDEGG
jgi:beta-aspartyl-peptidase (threonine type)